MSKRFFIGSSFFLFFLLVLWGVYTLLFSTKETAETTEKLPLPPEVTQPPEAQQSSSIQVVIEAPILSPSISFGQEESILYIDKNTGSLQQFNISTGKKEVLSSVIAKSPISAIWKKDGSSVYIKESHARDTSFYFVPFSEEESPVSIKGGTQYLLWDELENNILYTYKDASGQVTLNRANPDGSHWNEVAKLPATPILMASIPKSPRVAFWERPANARIGVLKSVNLSGGDVKTVFPGKYGANYLWSPNGEKILMSWSPEKNGSKMALAILNKNGGEYTDLNSPTLVDKCVWSGNNTDVYCAIPGSVPQTSAMPDAFYGDSFTGNDTFWKIDTTTGGSERIVSLDNIVNSYDAVNLLLSWDETILFFLNRKDLNLYKIEL